MTGKVIDRFSDSTEPDLSKFRQLRELLLGREVREIEDLKRRLDELELTAEEVAELLPDAIAQRTNQDNQLARALAPTLEGAFDEAVQRNPEQITNAIFPILGPAIRKAIAETMAGFISTLNRAIEHSLSIRGLKWRWEAWRTGVPYAEIVIKHALVYRVEQIFLIQSETGLLLAHAVAEDLESQDPDLISGMLTAITDFVQDSFHAGAGEGLRIFSVGELTVYVEQGPKALIAAVVRGNPPPNLSERIQGTLETIHLRFSRSLKEFDGDTAHFEAAVPILEDSLETVLTTDDPEEHGHAPRVMWAVGIGILVLLIGWAIWSARRWDRAVTALESEAGIVLTRYDRGLLSGWSFEGLRDPAAPDPNAVLSQAGFGSGRISFSFEPYLSLDPEVTLSRASKALTPPSTIELSLQGDTLSATGTAGREWVLRAQDRAVQVPGVTAVNFSDVRNRLPQDVAAIRDRIEAGRLTFALGSAQLDAPALARLRAVAEEIPDLLEGAAPYGYTARLRLVGRADTTGTDQTNRLLSQFRADNARAALVRLGVPDSIMETLGLGTSDPLGGPDPEASARLNRSVTFAVTLSLEEE